jgi:nitrous oxidase accessory protein NosD
MLISLSFKSTSAFAIFCLALNAAGTTLCVHPGGSKSCFNSIQAAVTAAEPGDTVRVWPGKYHESVTISKSLSLIAVDATGLPNGINVDGTGATLSGVVVKGFTVQNANFEGILVRNAWSITIAYNKVIHNDPKLNVQNATCPGLPSWETAEGEDCGEGIHLVGVADSIVAHNIVERRTRAAFYSAMKPQRRTTTSFLRIR